MVYDDSQDLLRQSGWKRIPLSADLRSQGPTCTMLFPRSLRSRIVPNNKLKRAILASGPCF